MPRISISEFLPPIIPRLIKFAKRSISATVPRHPFDQVPSRLDAKVILDIGANVGDVALAALHTYPLSKVICFEPVQATRAVLEQRLRPFGERAVIFKEALSDTAGSAEINITSFHGANSISAQSSMHSTLNPHVKEVGKETISLVRLDEFAKINDFPNIDILKIDVEGHELEVLIGGKEFISTKVDTIIVEASLMRDSSLERQSVIEIFSLLNEMGFRLINIFDLHHVEDFPLMCIQMDCVFRHKSRLT